MLQLRVERQKRGWSLARLVALTGGIDQAALSRIEREIWPCGPSWRKRIAEAFDLPEEELFKEQDAGNENISLRKVT